MKLTKEQIKSIAFGYTEIIEEEKGLRFCNMTKKQREAFSAYDEISLPFDGGFTGRSSLATGVRLDFHTDSKSFGFNAVTKVAFEVSIDGLLYRRYTPEELPARIPLGEGEKRITLWFPSHSAVGYSLLSEVTLDDGASITPHEYSEKLLFVGDSITHGWESDYIPMAYTHRVASALNADFVVQGVSGAQFWPDTVDTLPFSPDRVFVAMGTNDIGMGKSEADIRRDAADFYAKIANNYSQKKLYAMTPIWRAFSNKEEKERFLYASGIIKDEAEKHGFTVIDGMTLVPPILAFYTDGLHPNAAGFSLMAENILRAIKAK